MRAPIGRTDRTTPFRAISTAILRGFVRDRTSVFFALVFPLMFLVLFGGLFSDQSQSRLDLVEVGDVTLVDDLPAELRTSFEETFELSGPTALNDAVEQVRKGDADVALEQRGDTLIAHYTQTDPARAAITQGALRAFVDGTNLALTGQPPSYTLDVVSVEDDSMDAIQYYTPGLLGWAVAMSAAFGAAATLQGWRQTKLLRRLQLAPVSTRSVVGARVSVTVAIALVQMAVFLGVGTAFFDLSLTGSWWAAVPLLVVGTLCFMSIGLLAGAIAKTQEGAVNAANFLILPMALLGGSFFPLDAAPAWLRGFAQVLPLRHLNDGMLDVMVRGEPASAALAPMGILAAFAAVVTLAAARLFRWETT